MSVPRSLRHLTESQIRKAQAEGKLSGLEGEGKPLPDRPENAYIDSADAVGHRIMAEAGALPEEITLKRQLAVARADYAAAKGTTAEKPAMARISELKMKLAIAQDARRKFLKG
ncbi:MAG: DUF1992 domain-containing protein [Alphaproteobacteria bacterium]|nr:DUF1992 domain-containing protein [Alphaproteobacteria bacterium]